VVVGRQARHRGVLMRGRGMKRCLAEGAERFAVFVGAAELANDLMIVASLLRSVGEAAGSFTAWTMMLKLPAEIGSAVSGFSHVQCENRDIFGTSFTALTINTLNLN
jgi:hypothetical protein